MVTSSRYPTFEMPGPFTPAEPVHKVYGKVKDQRTGSPLVGARVAIGINETTTDDRGNYELTDVPLGTHVVIASKGGYLTQTNSVTIRWNDRRKEVNFELPRVVHLSIVRHVPETNWYNDEYTIHADLTNDGPFPITGWAYKFEECEVGTTDWRTVGADTKDIAKQRGESWTVTSDKMIHSWQWYYTDWLGAHELLLEKYYDYHFWCAAKRRANISAFDFEDEDKEFGRIRVKVFGDKLIALRFYNLAFSCGCAATILAAIYTVGISLWITSLVAGGSFLGVAELLSLIETWMRDPFTFDSRYKKTKTIKLLPYKNTSLVNTFRNFSRLNDTLSINKDKYLTARLLKDRQNTEKIKTLLKKQIKLMEREAKRIDNFALKHRSTLKKIRADLKVARKLLRKGVPKKSREFLRKSGFTNLQINNYRKLILSKHANRIKQKNAFEIFKTISYLNKKILERNKAFLH